MYTPGNRLSSVLIWFLGYIKGGKLTFDCQNDRGIGYYIMGIIPLILFGKQPSFLTFTVIH